MIRRNCEPVQALQLAPSICRQRRHSMLMRSCTRSAPPTPIGSGGRTPNKPVFHGGGSRPNDRWCQIWLVKSGGPGPSSPRLGRRGTLCPGRRGVQGVSRVSRRRINESRANCGRRAHSRNARMISIASGGRCGRASAISVSLGAPGSFTNTSLDGCGSTAWTRLRSPAT
jgi:hypothetical protein